MAREHPTRGGTVCLAADASALVRRLHGTLGSPWNSRSLLRLRAWVVLVFPGDVLCSDLTPLQHRAIQLSCPRVVCAVRSFPAAQFSRQKSSLMSGPAPVA